MNMKTLEGWDNGPGAYEARKNVIEKLAMDKGW